MRPMGILPRALRTLVLASAALFVFNACSEDEKKPLPPPPPTPTTLEWAVEPVLLDAFEATAQLEVIVKDQGGKPMKDQMILWASSDESIVEVDENGLVTARSNGKAEVSASVGEELSIHLPVEVAQLATSASVEPKGLTLDAVGAEATLEVVARDRNGFVIEAAEVVWLSKDESVATVDKEGRVSAVAAGSTEIEARVEGTEAVDTVRVVVTPLPAELALGIFPDHFIAGVPTQVVVQVTDRNGHPVVGADHKVSIALGENPAHGSLSGVQVVNAVDGIATFGDLSIDRAGTGYTLLAWVDGVGEVESSVFDVQTGPAARLAFVSQPQRGVSETELAPFEIQVQDASGNLVADASHAVTLALRGGAPGATLSGDPLFEAEGGRVIVSGLSVDLAANDYFFEATADGLAGAGSGRFDVVPGEPARLSFLRQPSDALSRTVISPAVQVEILDNAGNRVAGSNLPVSVELNPADGGLQGVVQVNAVGGVATFLNLSVEQAGSYALIANAGGLRSPPSASFQVRAGEATRLSFHQQPPPTVRSGEALPQVVVRALDAAGNFADATSGTVTLSLGQNPGGGKLSGTLSASLVNGEAVFTDLRLDKVATGYTLRASALDLAVAESSSIEVTPGDPAKLAFAVQPRSAAAATDLAPAVQVEILDAAGNRVKGATHSVSLALGQNPAGGTLTGGDAVNAIDGVATFAGLRIDKAGIGYALRASSGALTEAESAAFDIRAGAPSKLAVLTQPQDGVAGSPLAPIRFEIRDAQDNLVPEAKHAVTVSLKNPNGATLSGTRTVSAAKGVATFSNLSIDKASDDATPYLLQASAAGLSPVETAPFAIRAGAPARLHFAVQPGNGTSGQALAQQPVVHLLDASGNLVKTANEQVTLSLAQNPAGGKLAGTFSVAAVDGVATFTDLSVDKAASGYTLRASAASLVGAESASFDIRHGSVAQLAFQRQPSNVAAGVAMAPGVQVALHDAAGNLVEDASHLVTLSLGQNPGNAALDGTRQVSAVNGVATFDDLKLDKVGKGYTLRAQIVTPGVPVAESGTFDVRPGAAHHLAFLVQPADGKAGLPLAPVQVEIHDAHDNRVQTGSHVVQLSLLNANGATLGGKLSVASTGGVATFSGLTVDREGNGYQLLASATELADGTSDAFRIEAAAPAKLAFRSQPPSSLVSEEAFQVVVEVLDAKGNLATAAEGIVKLALGQGPSGAALGGTLVANIVDGVATFNGLSVAKAGSGYTVVASATGLTSSESQVFTVTAGEAAGLAFSVQPSRVASGATMAQVKVEIVDKAGNRVPGATDVVRLAFGQNPGGGVLGGNSALGTAAVEGVATFDDLSVDKAGMGYTLVASSGSLDPVESAAFQVDAGEARKLVFTVQPRSVTADEVLGPVWVEIRDEADNLVKTANDSVTLSLAQPSDGILVGTTTVDAVGGVARFFGLSVPTAGQGYELVATSGSLAQATSDPFDVLPGQAAKLAFLDVEPVIGAGKPLMIAVEVQDSGGNRVENANLAVMLELWEGPAGGELFGTRIVNAVDGLARFDHVWINQRGTGYVLRAHSGNLEVGQSPSFDVVPSATALSFVSAPGAVVAGGNFSVEVEVLDELGDRYVDESFRIDLELSDETPLLGETSVESIDGLASFILRIEKAGSDYVLEASAPGLLGDSSAPFDVAPAAPTQLLAIEPPTELESEQEFDLHLRVVDAYGNGVPGVTVDIQSMEVTYVHNVPPGGLPSDGKGDVIFEDVYIKRAGTIPIWAYFETESDFVYLEDVYIEVRPGPPAMILFSGHPVLPIQAGTSFNLEARFWDNAGNATTPSEAVEFRVYRNGDLIRSEARIVVDAAIRSQEEETIVGTYTYEYESQGISDSVQVEVVPGPSVGLVWTIQPVAPDDEDFRAGVSLPTLEVRNLDAFGNTITDEGGDVRLILIDMEDETEIEDGIAGGDDEVPLSNGIATFEGVTIERAGSYRLKATHASLSEALSADFVILPGDPAGLAFTVQPPLHLEPEEAFMVEVQVVDAYDNPLTEVDGWIRLSLHCDDPSVEFRPDLTVEKESEAGAVTFEDLQVDDDAAACRIVAEMTAPGLNGTSRSFEVGFATTVVNGLTFIRVPAGEHRRCIPESLAAPCDGNEEVVQMEAFWMIETETPAAAYDACVAESVCPATMAVNGCTSGVAGKENHPINCLDVGHAQAFCQWLGGDLPTLDQWHYAAKAGQNTKWPWGGEELLAGTHANVAGSSTTSVGAHPAGRNPWGFYDFVGNVGEIVYVPDSDVGVVGGSYYSSVHDTHRYYTEGFALLQPAPVVGFRCVIVDES